MKLLRNLWYVCIFSPFCRLVEGRRVKERQRAEGDTAALDLRTLSDALRVSRDVEPGLRPTPVSSSVSDCVKILIYSGFKRLLVILAISLWLFLTDVWCAAEYLQQRDI